MPDSHPAMNRMRIFWREQVRPWWYDYEWPVLGAIAVVLLALGYYGFLLHQRAENKTPYVWDLLFQSAQLFVKGWPSFHGSVCITCFHSD